MAQKNLPPEVVEAQKIVSQYDRHWKLGFLWAGVVSLAVLVVLIVLRLEAFAVVVLFGVGVGIGYFWSYTRDVLLFAAASQIVRSHERQEERQRFGNFDKYQGDEVPDRVEKARAAVGKFRIQVIVFGSLLFVAPVVHFMVDRIFGTTTSVKAMSDAFAIVWVIGLGGAWAFVRGGDALAKWWKARAILEEWERMRIEILSRRHWEKMEADRKLREAERMGRY